MFSSVVITCLLNSLKGSLCPVLYIAMETGRYTHSESRICLTSFLVFVNCTAIFCHSVDVERMVVKPQLCCFFQTSQFSPLTFPDLVSLAGNMSPWAGTK